MTNWSVSAGCVKVTGIFSVRKPPWHLFAEYRMRVAAWLTRRGSNPWLPDASTGPQRVSDRRMSMATIVRKIELPQDEVFKSYADWQALYLDREQASLLPNTEIWIGGRLKLKINSLGCKGRDVDTDVPIIAFFGDSATFGVSFADDSWPQRVKVSGCQPLNCAVEGYDMQRCLDRYLQIRNRVPLAAVVVYVGWHNIIYNHNGEEYWRSILDRFRGDHAVAFCSIATCLTEECRVRGIASLLCSDVPRKEYANYFEYNAQSLNKRYFNFWCNLEPTAEHIGSILDNVARYNAFLREYCRARGCPLVDLGGLLRPKSYCAVPRDFFDVCHLRPGAYARTAAFVGEALKLPVQEALAARGGVSTAGAAGRAPVFATDRADDLRKNIYPLW